MVAAEGYSTSLVDSLDLFEALRRRIPFDLYAIGTASSEELRRVPDLPALQPLLLLVPMDSGLPVHPYRLVHPGAHLIDRELRDVDAIRREFQPDHVQDTPGAWPGLSAESIQRAFEPFGLSERQLEVLERALRGDTSSQIAARLYISELTVRNHLHAIYERVGVSGRRELLGRFVQGLMEGHA